MFNKLDSWLGSPGSSLSGQSILAVPFGDRVYSCV